MIAWKYIDKTAATISAMRDYDNMRAIINNTPDEIKTIYENLSSPRASAISGVPSTRNPQSSEDRLADQIDRLDVLRERYSTAVAYMKWFEPAWGTMTDREKHILRECYMTESLRNGARLRLSEELNYTERHIDNLRDKALKRLRTLLFG
jgi:DNA-directed RNA polymerase sigma subunit (sigma70/sigma32)